MNHPTDQSPRRQTVDALIAEAIGAPRALVRSDRFAELNLLAAGGSPADMRKLVVEETRRWTEVIRKAGIQPE